MLLEVLSNKGRRDGENAARFVSMPCGLRTHLRRALPLRLLEDGYASEEMKEDLLGRDLGL